jgi:hypothetical protein
MSWCLQLPPPPPFHPPTLTFGLCAVISPWSCFHHCARLLGLGCRQLIPTVGTLLTVRWGPTCVLLCPRMQIHWPGPPSKDATKDPACQAPDADGRWGSCRRATWRAMLKLLADGTDGGSRAVGVSNFERDHLMDLMPVSIHRYPLQIASRVRNHELRCTCTCVCACGQRAAGPARLT